MARGLSGRAGRAYPAPRMPVSARLALVVLLALGGPGLGGCSVSTELRRVQTPRDGVTLAYTRPTGQSFEGTVKLGNTRAVEGLVEPLSQTLTCDVNMVLLGTSEAGMEVRATFTSVELDWDLPPAATYSSDELVDLAHQQLRGMQVTFVVRPDGRVQALPAAPPATPPELREVIETMLMGLEAFFVPMPPEPLARRDRWHESFEHTTADGLKMQIEHDVRLDGSYEHRTEQRVVRRLMIEQRRLEQRPSEDGPVTVERDVHAEVMFDDTGYPAEIDRAIREADPELGVVFRKVRAKWNATRGVVPELLNPPARGDVQVIRDPCNADYVGPLTCDDAEADEADDTAADDAAEPAQPDEG